MDYVQQAVIMADDRGHNRNELEWNHDFVDACNWLKYKENERALSKAELDRAVKKYGNVD